MAAILRRNFSKLLLYHHLSRPFSALPEPIPPPSSHDPPPTFHSTDRNRHPMAQFRLAILAESDPEKISDLFISAYSSGNLRRLHSNRPVFSLTVNKLYHARRPDLVRRILDPCLTDANSPKTEGFLTRIISLYSSAGLPDAAMDAFRLQSPHPRTDVSLSALLSAFLHNRCFDELKSTFKKASEEFNITPGLPSHNVLLTGLCQNGEVEYARKLLNEMIKRENSRPEPNIVSYNALLNGYLKKGDEALFDEILKEISDKGLHPNAFTFNCRISRFCSKGESFKAEELLEVMLSKGIRPNVSTFNYLIHGYCKEGKVSSAMRLYKRLKVLEREYGKNGLMPNTDIYNVLIKSLVEKERFGDALWVCKQSLARRKVPPFDDLKALVEGLVEGSSCLIKEPKVDEAKDLVSRVRAVVNGRAKDAWEKLESELFPLEEEKTSPN